MCRAGIFEIERQGETVIFTPTTNLSELEYVESNARGVIDVLCDLSIKNLVIDFQKTDYFGSSALELFVKLWKMVTQRDGRMAVCNLSENQHEILRTTKLGSLWPICVSRGDAMKAVEARNAD
jgi:anti-anti-sigma factor